MTNTQQNKPQSLGEKPTMQRFDIENAALWASGKKNKVRGGIEKRGGRAFFLKINTSV